MLIRHSVQLIRYSLNLEHNKHKEREYGII